MRRNEGRRGKGKKRRTDIAIRCELGDRKIGRKIRGKRKRTGKEGEGLRRKR